MAIKAMRNDQQQQQIYYIGQYNVTIMSNQRFTRVMNEPATVQKTLFLEV